MLAVGGALAYPDSIAVLAIMRHAVWPRLVRANLEIVQGRYRVVCNLIWQYTQCDQKGDGGDCGAVSPWRNRGAGAPASGDGAKRASWYAIPLMPTAMKPPNTQNCQKCPASRHSKANGERCLVCAQRGVI
jgi:hypothetical protein